jgi:arginine N-succinyltransferase
VRGGEARRRGTTARVAPRNSGAAIVLRAAGSKDLAALARLAKRLDTVNLPSDPTALTTMLRRSARSFAGKVHDRAEAAYVFVAEDRSARRIAGASVIIAKHGTPDSPHYYLEMAEEERYSRTLRRLFRHTYLHLRRSFDGPTEVGGLVVDPAYRGHPQKVGKQLSYCRFLYMGMHPERFEPSVLAEMLPPLTASGASPLWECYGRRVTGLSFHDADLLSRSDKEFIDALFPSAPIYVCMLPEEVRDQIGVVGPQSAAALHVLQKIGLRFLDQIDPFDGGPYWGARLADVTLVRALRRAAIRIDPDARERAGKGEELLVATEAGGGFRAVRLHARPTRQGLRVSAADAARLDAPAGTRVATVPFV